MTTTDDSSASSTDKNLEIELDAIYAREMVLASELARALAREDSFDEFQAALIEQAKVLGKEAVKRALPFLMAALASAL